MGDGQVSVKTVLRGIDEAARVGFTPDKVNMVVKKGVNEDQIVPMARHFRHSGHVLRFIEFMDVGTSNGWDLKQVVSGAEILKLIEAQFPLQAVESAYRGEVAARSEEHTSELQSLMRISYAVCCLKKKIRIKQ